MLRKQLLKIIEKNDLVDRFIKEYLDSYFDLQFVKEGHENASYIFSANDKEYVLRISKPEKSIERIEKEISFMNYLNKDNVPAPRVIKSKIGALVSSTNIDGQNIKAIVMDKMGGNSPKKYTDELISEIGKWMARLHNSSLNYTSVPESILEIETEYFTHNELNVEKIEDKKTRDFLVEAKDFKWDVSSLPQGIIHSDFHKNNLLTVSDEITGILDFDDITKSAFVRDIGVMINNIAYGYLFNKTSLDRISIFLNAYQKVRSLNELEINNLKTATLFRNYGLAAFFYWIEDFDLKEYADMKEIISNIDFTKYNNG